MLSTIQDFVLPRMRGLIYVACMLGMTIIDLGIGPYIAGLVSDITGDLSAGIMSLYFFAPLVWALIYVGMRCVDHAEVTKAARTKAVAERFDWCEQDLARL